MSVAIDHPHGEKERATMGESRQNVSRMRAITISREYGSGGGEIAGRLARQLEWHLVDHEVVEEVARRLGITEGEAENRDERAETIIERLLKNMQNIDPSLAGMPADAPVLDAHDYAAALRDVVEGAAGAGHVVIIGRGGQVILRDHRDVLHVRIVAPLEQRVAYVARREALSAEDARRRVQQKDRSRQQYMSSQHQAQVDDMHLYDLVLNTAVLDLDSCVDLIRMALARKALRLDVPEEALGPAAGMPRYPGSPGDLPVPEAPPTPGPEALRS